MDAKQVKTMRKLITSFFLFLILKLVEELYIIPRLYNTMGLVSCIGGLLILFVYIRLDNKPLEVIGMLFSRHKFGKGIRLAVLLNAVSAVIVYAMAYLKFTNNGVHFSVYYDKTANAYSEAGIKMFLFWIVFGLIISLIHAFFYEMAFRGLLLTLAAKAFPFRIVNLLQSALYTLWYMIPVLRILLYAGSAYPKKQLLTLVLFILFYEMLTAVKLGMLRRATGSIWVCIFDHAIFTYLFDMVHVQPFGTAHSTDNLTYVIMIGYQALALICTTVYYNKKLKKIADEQRSEFLKNNA